MSSPMKEHVFSNFSCMNLTSEAEAQAQCIQDNWECKLRFHYRHQADLHGYSRSNVHRVHMKQLAQVIVLCLGITELEEIARICSTFVPFFPWCSCLVVHWRNAIRPGWFDRWELRNSVIFVDQKILAVDIHAKIEKFKEQVYFQTMCCIFFSFSRRIQDIKAKRVSFA